MFQFLIITDEDSIAERSSFTSTFYSLEHEFSHLTACLTALTSFVNHFLLVHSSLFQTTDCALVVSPIRLISLAVSSTVNE